MMSELSRKSASKDDTSSGVNARTKAAESKGFDGLLAAQRTLGNRAVSALVQSARRAANPAAMSAQLGTGERLPADVRGFFEPRFGQDFSDVRIFHDDIAAKAAEAANADAFTVGRNIAFNTGRFAPWTADGRRLLGHELAHVVQQGRGGPTPDGPPNSAAEHDAHQAGRAAGAGAARIPVRQSSGIGIARQEKQDDDERTRRNVGLANRLYTAFLSSPIVPDTAKQAVKGTNEWLKQEARNHGISDQQRDQILSQVVQTVGTDVVASAQTVVEPPAAPPPPTPPPPVVQVLRRSPTVVKPPPTPLTINLPGPKSLIDLSVVLVPGSPGDQASLAPVSVGNLPRVPLADVLPGSTPRRDLSAFVVPGQPADQTALAPAAPQPFDVTKFVDPSAPRDPTQIVWAGDPARQPSWLTGARYWTDARGNTNFLSPEAGLSVWNREGKQLGLPAPGTEQAERALRAESELSLTGGKRYVEGRGWLGEDGWQTYLQERSDKLRVEAERKIQDLRGATAEWNKTQGGWAYVPSQASHLLGGRSSDEPDKIVAGMRQDVEIALHKIEQARTPEELAEAEGHVTFAQGYGGTRFYNYKEDVYTGGERTITGIKVGAVLATAYVSAPVLFSYGGGAITLKVVGGAALTGGGLSAARQGVQLWEGTRKDFSFGEVGQGAVFGGGLALMPELAPVALGMGVEGAADEFSQGHFKTGAFDAATILLPVAVHAAPKITSWARPRVAAIALRVGTGLSDFNPASGFIGSPRAPTIELSVGSGLGDVTGLPRSGGIMDFADIASLGAGEASPVVPRSPGRPASTADLGPEAPSGRPVASSSARPVSQHRAALPPATRSRLESGLQDVANAGREDVAPSDTEAAVQGAEPVSEAAPALSTPRVGTATPASSPLIGPTSGAPKTFGAMLRQVKWTVREYWNRLYGLGSPTVNSVTLHPGFGDAELTAIKLIEDTPGREVGIYRNSVTGEHAVVQGSGNWKGGEVTHLDALPEAAGQHWILVEHYHPERNWAVQFPSGGIDASGNPTGDFAVLLYDHGETNATAVLQGQPSSVITQRVSARIRYRDPVSGAYHFTTYGYDPAQGQVGRFFVKAETETGASVDYSFRDISGIGTAHSDYQRHMGGIRPGEPVVKAAP